MSERVHPGFRSLETELDAEPLPVAGELPAWLSGTLVRNGPGRFDADGERLRHWFDGLAMLRAYEFGDGVRYSNRFLRTGSYRQATAGTVAGQFATDVGGLAKLKAWLTSVGFPEPTDNANVHVAEVGGKLVAQTEVPRWVCVDPETLETNGEFVFRDLFDPHMITAHLVRDPESGDQFGHALTFGRPHEYHLFRVPAGTRRRERVASIPADKPAYVHSVGVSESALVLIETPLRIDVVRALSPFREGFFDLLSWEPDRETRLHVVDRTTGTVAEATAEPFFVFHVVNAFDDGGDVVVDLVAFADDAIVGELSLSAVSSGGFDAAPPGRLVRYRLSPDGTVQRWRLYDGGIELPRVVPGRQTRPHRYVYGQSTDREGANGLVKVDTERETAVEWRERDLYVEEPIPVRRPDATAEDDGVVLAPALDAAAERSALLVFDATTLEELARAEVPHHNPFGFHGRFFEW